VRASSRILAGERYQLSRATDSKARSVPLNFSEVVMISVATSTTFLRWVRE
jgi:hypothetical protein